jgi:hypothetical protein
MEEWSAGCAGRAKLRLSRFKLTSSVKVVEDWSVGGLGQSFLRSYLARAVSRSTPVFCILFP